MKKDEKKEIFWAAAVFFGIAAVILLIGLVGIFPLYNLIGVAVLFFVAAMVILAYYAIIIVSDIASDKIADFILDRLGASAEELKQMDEKKLKQKN